jgi:hypothetical protein
MIWPNPSTSKEINPIFGQDVVDTIQCPEGKTTGVKLLYLYEAGIRKQDPDNNVSFDQQLQTATPKTPPHDLY